MKVPTAAGRFRLERPYTIRDIARPIHAIHHEGQQRYYSNAARRYIYRTPAESPIKGFKPSDIARNAGLSQSIARHAWKISHIHSGQTFMIDPLTIWRDKIDHEYHSVSRRFTLTPEARKFIEEGGHNVLRMKQRMLLDNCYEIPLSAVQKYNDAAKGSWFSLEDWMNWQSLGLTPSEAEAFNRSQFEKNLPLGDVGTRLSSNLTLPSHHQISETPDGDYVIHTVLMKTHDEHILTGEALWMLALNRRDNTMVTSVIGTGGRFRPIDMMNDELVTVLWANHAEKFAAVINDPVLLKDVTVKMEKDPVGQTWYSEMLNRLPKDGVPYDIRVTSKILDFADKLGGPILLMAERMVKRYYGLYDVQVRPEDVAPAKSFINDLVEHVNMVTLPLVNRDEEQHVVRDITATSKTLGDLGGGLAHLPSIPNDGVVVRGNTGLAIQLPDGVHVEIRPLEFDPHELKPGEPDPSKDPHDPHETHPGGGVKPGEHPHEGHPGHGI